MKKAVTLFLAVVMAVGLMAGCGGAAETTETTEPEQSAAVSEVPEMAEPETTFAIGTIEADAYSNSFSDLAFTLPEGWTFATDEELESVMGAGSEVMFGDDTSAAEQYALESTVYDMLAYAEGGSPNVIVMYENLTRYLGGSSMTEEDYLEQVSQQLADLEDMNYELGDVTDETIGNYDYKSMAAAVPDYGLNQCYLVRRVGDYMMCIVITSPDEKPLDLLIDNFQ